MVRRQCLRFALYLMVLSVRMRIQYGMGRFWRIFFASFFLIWNVLCDGMAAAAGVKVKVVLKRAELEWLMSQLKTGDRRLEDVLNQMATARALSSALSAAPPPPPHRAGDGWRPRLECILECHELAAT